MQRSFATFLLSAVLLVAAAALVWSATNDEPPVPPGAGGQAPGTPVAPSPDQPPPLLPPTAPRVQVEVHARERYLPPPPQRVQAMRAFDGVELPTRLLAGVGAGFDALDGNAGIAAAEIEFEGVRLVRQVPVGEAVTRPVVGARITVRGRVVDPAQEPIVAARVWLGEIDAEGNLREGKTDGEGRFELDTPSGDGVPFVVRAEGRASVWRVVAVQSPGPDLQMMLQPGAPLEVQLAVLGQDLERARLFVVPCTAVTSELSQFPFFLQAMTDGFAVDGNGRAKVGELPTSGQVGILVRHALAPGSPAHEVALDGKYTRAIVPLQLATAKWSGRVVDPAGQALSGVTVWSRPPRAQLAAAGSLRLLPPHLGVQGVCQAQTDADGAFVLGGLADPGAVLSLRAHGCAGRDLVWAELAAGVALVLPPWHGGEPAFRLLPPVAGAAWVAEADLAGGIRATLGKDEPWQVAFPHAGRFDVVVTSLLGSGKRASKTFHDVQATGLVELQAPRPE